MAWNITASEVEVGIETEGPLKALGHDRVFHVPVDVRISGDASAAQVETDGDLTGAEVLGEVSTKDRKDILKRMHGEVLQTDRFARFSYQGRFSKAASQVSGTLTLRGVEQDCDLPLSLSWEGDRFQAQGQRMVDLASFGVRPYKALLGALKVKTLVTVRYRVTGEIA